MQPLKILYLTAEVAPFAKAGGLADVAAALPKALAALGHEVRVVMPAYAQVEGALRNGVLGVHCNPTTLRVPMGNGHVPAGVLEANIPGSNVPVYFIAERRQFGDRPDFYGYRDDASRFTFFSRAALDLAVGAWGWRPDVVHAHDWHAAPAVAWLATTGQHDERYARLPTVYTIHNLAHQGTAPWHALYELGMIAPKLQEERPGQVNFMARGIFHGTMITTVSPTYAREIMSREGGFGLDGLLRHRHFDVHGILNGLDYQDWNPATDRNLAAQYDAATPELRLANKRALQARAGLAQRDDVPLVAMVTRLDGQKGLDIAGHVFHMLMNGYAGDVQCVVLGAGWPQYESMLRHLSGYHHGRMTAFIGYDAALAPLIYGGSDLFLMPSAFEPCGLGQMIAMRYGSIPVVRATGGLADTVRPGVTGFSFWNYSADDCWNTLREALHVFWTDKEGWRAMQQRAMSGDWSWEASARAYQQVYGWAIARVRGW